MKLNQKIIFRADGNTNIGLGHLYRCISLAQMLSDKFNITFVSHSIPQSVKNNILSLKFNLKLIENEDDFFSKICSSDIVVLDGYNFDYNYQLKVKSIGSVLVVIDDLHDKKYCADLIINHAPGIKEEDYNSESYTKYALGLRFALLRPSFLKEAQKEKYINSVSSLFICFGGSDAKNFTLKVLTDLESEIKEMKVTVVTGSSYKYSEQLEKFIENKHTITLRNDITELEMINLMSKSDVAIVPASGMIMECMAVGNIIITGSCIDNQKWLLNGFDTFSNVFNTGDFNSESLNKAFQLAKVQKWKKDFKIDGKSNVRISNLFINLKT